MQDLGLYAVYKLHLVDSALVDLQSHVKGIDTGEAEANAYKLLDETSRAEREAAKKAAIELKVLEDEVNQNSEKMKRFETQLYSGTVTNSREVENLQKEVTQLAKHDEELRQKADAARHTLPLLVEPALAAEKKMKELQATVATKREKAKTEYARIQVEFAKTKALRPAALAEVNPILARRYDFIRQKTGTTAVALVTERDTCSHCGMHVAEKAKEHVREGQVEPCEQCGRILFILMPEA